MSAAEWHEETLARQLAMTPQTWAALQAHGVTETTTLRLDFAYRAAGEEQAEALVAFLRLETDYDVEVDFTRPVPGEEQAWSVVGTTHPTAVSAEILTAWVTWMVAAGAEYGGCEFDGWGAAVGG